MYAKCNYCYVIYIIKGGGYYIHLYFGMSSIVLKKVKIVPVLKVNTIDICVLKIHFVMNGIFILI